MTKETIETIRFALRFLKGVNEAIFSLEKSHLSHLLYKFQTATSKVAMRTLSHDIAIHCSIMEELDK